MDTKQFLEKNTISIFTLEKKFNISIDYNKIKSLLQDFSKSVHEPKSPCPRKCFSYKKPHVRASLVAQWRRIRLPMQETRVQSLIQQDPVGHRETKLAHHNYCACALEPGSRSYWAHLPCWSLCTPEPMPYKRSLHNEKAVQQLESSPLLTCCN